MQEQLIQSKEEFDFERKQWQLKEKEELEKFKLQIEN